MNISRKTGRIAVNRRSRLFRATVLAAALLTAGVVTVIAKYGTSQPVSNSQAKQIATANQPGNKYVSVEVGGKKLQVNAQTLQQGPLTQEQAQQLADALKDNQSTDGLVQVQNADGSVSVDLEGRFQNVFMARKNDDGSVSHACVDNPTAAAAFLKSDSKPGKETGPGRNKKVAVIE